VCFLTSVFVLSVNKDPTDLILIAKLLCFTFLGEDLYYIYYYLLLYKQLFTVPAVDIIQNKNSSYSAGESKHN